MKTTNRKFEYQRNSEDEWVEVPTGQINWGRIFLVVFVTLNALFLLFVGLRVMFKF